MYTPQPKKILIINILDILRRYSDENHRLSQKDIEDILEKEYSMKAGRKAIKRNLMDLIDFGYNLNYTEINRNGKSGEETICTDWYLERDFSDAELRLLIDSVMFSKHIPTRQCRQLIGKLEDLSSKHFSVRMKHVKSLPEPIPANPQIFYTIEILDEAIERHCQVSFGWTEFNYLKHRTVRMNPSGKAKRFTFNPYQMVATNGHYYLIGNFDAFDNIAYVRLDHICDIELLSSKAKPMKNVKGLEKGLSLPKHMAEHIYMLYGDTVTVKFRCDKKIGDQIVDWFGLDYRIVDEDENTFTAVVDVNERAMRFWAVQYGTFVEVLEPQNLRMEIVDIARKIESRYKKK